MLPRQAWREHGRQVATSSWSGKGGSASSPPITSSQIWKLLPIKREAHVDFFVVAAEGLGSSKLYAKSSHTFSSLHPGPGVVFSHRDSGIGHVSRFGTGLRNPVSVLSCCSWDSCNHHPWWVRKDETRMTEHKRRSYLVRKLLKGCRATLRCANSSCKIRGVHVSFLKGGDHLFSTSGPASHRGGAQ